MNSQENSQAKGAAWRVSYLLGGCRVCLAGVVSERRLVRAKLPRLTVQVPRSNGARGPPYRPSYRSKNDGNWVVRVQKERIRCQTLLKGGMHKNTAALGKIGLSVGGDNSSFT